MLIPRDLYECEVGPRPTCLPDRITDLIEAPQPSATAIAELYDAIRAARSPVLLAGSGVDRCSDPGAVVDQFGRVHGLAGLRIADASVMPTIPTANTHLTCVAIGERVATWMREAAD